MKNFEVKIYIPSNSEDRWYVYVYDNLSKKIVHKTYKGINSEPDLFKRELICKSFKKALEVELDNGWTPIKVKNKAKPLPQPYQNDITIIAAYKKALEFLQNTKREKKTKSDYKTHKKFFLEAVEKLEWNDNLFSELDQYHFNLILNKMCELRKCGEVYFNKHLNLCKSFNTILVDNFIIKESKVHGLSEKDYTAPDKRLITPEEQTKIIKHFRNICPQFITKLKVLYHLDLRPKEIRLLKVGMIDQEKWYFKLPGEITKNDKDSIVLIPDDLKKDLIKLDLSNPEYYLFGIEKIRSRDRDKIFKPSPFQISKNAGNNLWRKEVKIGLGIDSDMYSLKKKNNNDKLERGWSIEEVKEVNRHSSIEMTKIYATRYSEIIQEKQRDNYGTFE
ncbi:site-specific integrase [Chryseobacterium gallinarum]|uniref:Site-specific integrase n=1 Tax=Chryseobacterium gallinarum TaxID=1324352 RepID=A0ABX6KUH4_CHRGL|nr:site-specific integrase [Chryseobacterium gallinarum]QIY92256.1 site-specific integrase [Chryseobacterium gallinarum]